MSTIDNAGRIAYMYDQETDTWYSLAGVANTVASYNWTGTNTFSNTVIFEDVVRTEGGVNNFQNPNARDAALTSPINGIVAFVRQDNSGSQINQIQYYYNGRWRNILGDAGINSQNTSYTINRSDVGRTVIVNTSVANTVTIPAFTSEAFGVGEKVNIIQQGAGQTQIAGEDGSVVINSKNNMKKIEAQYGAASIINVAQNSWILIGDLAA